MHLSFDRSEHVLVRVDHGLQLSFVLIMRISIGTLLIRSNRITAALDPSSLQEAFLLEDSAL